LSLVSLGHLGKALFQIGAGRGLAMLNLCKQHDDSFLINISMSLKGGPKIRLFFCQIFPSKSSGPEAKPSLLTKSKRKLGSS
jgi:hypothetical protein